MITKEELSERYSKMTTSELLNILDHRHEYTDLAITAAIEELSKRKVSEEEINEIKKDEIENAQLFIRKNIEIELTFLEKNLFYFIWIPYVTFAFKRNFAEDGFILKLRQASYYSWLGFIFFVLAGLVSAFFNLPNPPYIAIWIFGFIIASAFDPKFNREFLRKRLERLIKQQKKNRL